MIFFLALMDVVGITILQPVVPYIVRRYSDEALMVTMLNRAGSAFIFPALTALTVERVSHHEQGALMGVTTALGSLMSFLGPLWAGLMYDHVMRGAPYWLGACVFVCAAYLLTRTRSWLTFSH